MQNFQPKNLTNSELINQCALILDREDLPAAYQQELLRRFTALAPLDEFPPKDPAQQDLFL
jgi:hypothetical protein